MTKSKRPYIPLATRLEAALRQLGLDPATAELDHDPALELREVAGSYFTKRGQEITLYTPDANDPRHLIWRSKEGHAVKTNGPGGEKRITTRGGDHGDAAHLRAVTRKEAEFRRRLLAKSGEVADVIRSAIRDTPEPLQRKRKIRSRGFEKRKPRA